MNFKNVILISVDCARRDAFPREWTHNINKIAENGLNFDCITTNPYTTAAHASMLTGKYPPNHGIRTMYDSYLRDDVKTIAEYLKGEGFKTACWSGYKGLLRNAGVLRGFNYVDDDSNMPPNFNRPDWFNDYRTNFMTWYDSRPHEEPEFLFFHHFHTHAGSESLVPPKYAGFSGDYEFGADPDIDYSYGMYHGKVKWFDEEWLNIIMDRYPLDNTLYIITGDHGDGWDEEREVGHRRHVYDETIRVPLVVSEDIVGWDDGELMSTIDIWEIIQLGLWERIKYQLEDFEHIYFETQHDDIPGFRVGLIDEDGKAVIKWRPTGFGPDLNYKNDNRLMYKLVEHEYWWKQEPNYSETDTELMEHLEKLGYV